MVADADRNWRNGLPLPGMPDETPAGWMRHNIPDEPDVAEYAGMFERFERRVGSATLTVSYASADAGARIRAIGQMVNKVADRAARRVCLGCGCRLSACACGTDNHPDGRHYAPDELGWFS